MNPLAIRIAADLKAFKANMAEMKGQLETTASSMKRMSSSFDGSKVIGDANAMVKAIGGVAGASKLTDVEMRRVNATTTEAIEKYKRLGREAPPEMIALRDATASVAQRTEALSGSLTKFASGARTMGIGLTAAVTAPIVGMGLAIVKLGMDAVESENLVSVSFGNMKGAAKEWAADLSKNLGLNRFETEKMAGTLFNMTTSMGLTRQAAFDMSTGVVKLAADMASFRNIRMEDALAKIKSGLTGEAEPLKQIGILVNDATIKTYAYANGIAKQGKELTEQQKVMARYGAIMKQTANDQGDLARTMDSPANQLRIMKSRVQEAATALGVSLLPMIQNVIRSVSEMVPYIQSGVEWFTKLPSGVQVSGVALAGLAAVIGPMLLVMSSLASAAVTMISLFGVGLPAAAGTSTVSLGLLTAGVKSLTVAMLANPWTAALLALGGLAVAYRAAAKEVSEHTDAERSLAREMTYGQGTYALQAQAIDRVSAAQKRLHDELNRNASGPGSHMNQYQTADQASLALERLNKAGEKLPPTLSMTAAEAQRLAEAFQKQVDILTGKALVREVAELARQVAAAGKQGGLSASEYQKLGKELEAMRERGAKLPPILRDIWFEHERLNPSIKVTTDAYKILAETMKQIKPVSLGMPTPTDKLPISDDPYGIIKQIEHSLILMGKDTRIKVPAMAAAKTWADAFKASIVKSLEGLGAVILGAIQGGGDVGKAAFASIGAGLGDVLGDSIRKALSKQVKNAAGEMVTQISGLGKLLGGLAGPLGALAGSALGGVFDKLFGKNQGREDAKGFAAGFGGFDALRQKMLILGAEGDNLWIKLTQNTKGPEQVKATIQAIEEALRKAEEAAAKTGETIRDTFKGPEGARGFPTRAQLQKAASDAEETWRFIKESGEYNAAEVERAWTEWQDALVAAGDKGAASIRKIDDELKSLHDSIANEAPEEIMGVIEAEARARIKSLEDEKAAIIENTKLKTMADELATGKIIDNTGEKLFAEAQAAATAAKSADKAFADTKVRAVTMDDELRRLFKVGYDIPIRFQVPGGLPGGPSTPAGSSPSSFGFAPTMPSKSSGLSGPVHVTVVTQLDGKVVAQNQVKYIPRELDFIGARR